MQNIPINRRAIVVIGAGLSGLTCALELSKRISNPDICVTIIEARDRVGGRIYSKCGIDLGAAWSWTSNDDELLRLAKALGVHTQHQYQSGHTLAQSQTGAVSIIGSGIGPAGDGSIRFFSNTSNITSALETVLQSSTNIQVQIIFNNQVTKIVQIDATPQQILIETIDNSTGEKNNYISQAVVIAAPPRVIMSKISFDPDLPSKKRYAMERTPTWMHDTGKVAFIYSVPFWRKKGFSGTVFSHKGPLRQVWDNSSSDGSVYALCGFVFGEDLRYLRDEASLKSSPIISQMASLFGSEAAEPSQLVFKSWLTDEYTAAMVSDLASLGESLPFGSPEVRSPYVNIVFAGTETAPGEHGHMNGAVIAGYRAASEVLEIIK
jgi:monoamine oxidase